MRIIASEVLREAAEASALFEEWERAMRMQWPAPDKTTVRRWNECRGAAEKASAAVIKAIRYSPVPAVAS